MMQDMQRISGRPSLTDLAYQALLEAIYDRTYAPGAQLNIDALARSLDISVTPVREALVRAASERLVIQESNKGFRVAPLLTRDEYHQLFEFRRLLELEAVSRATIDEEVIASLGAALRSMRSAGQGSRYEDLRAFSSGDHDFHRAFIASANNQFLTAAWDDLHHFMHVHRLYTRAGVFDLADAHAEHAAIVDAARGGDVRELTEAMRAHLSASERRLGTLLADASAEAA